MSVLGQWRRNRFVRAAAAMVVLGLLGTGAWQLFFTGQKSCVISTEFKSILGTSAHIVAVAPSGQESPAQDAIQAAASEMARVDGLVNADNSKSEIALFNAAKAGRTIKLSPATLEMLKLARQYAADTHGAFDATCRPLLVLWRDAQKQNRTPTESEIAQARAKVGWDKVELLDDGARKKIDGVEIELAGISRGYAIDLAVEAMRQIGVSGGMVSIGNDCRVFGSHGRGDVWPVTVKDPFDGDKPLATLMVRESAVCTRSNYEKSYMLNGKRVSRIADPRTGMPAELVPSVTTVSPKAVEGAWATALSVLGPDGLAAMPSQGICAMIVTGDKDKWNVLSSPQFNKLLQAPMVAETPATAPAGGARP